MREWLRYTRINFDYTQSYIAKSVGISQNTYSNIELGKRTPSVTVAKKIAKILNFDWTLFFKD